MSDVRVAFINNFPGATYGGGEVQLLTLVRGLVAHGAAVTVVCVAGSALEGELATVQGVRVVGEHFSATRVGALVKRLAAELGDTPIVQGTGFLTNNIARRVAKVTCAVVVNTVHVVPGAARLDGEGAAASLARAVLDRTAPRHVDRFVAVSQAVATGLAADGVDAHSIRVIHNGVDLERLQSQASDVLPVSMSHGAPLIGYVGRLEPVKGCEFFLRAAAMVRERFPESSYVVAGSGSAESSLRELAHSLGIADRVSFLGHLDTTAALISSLDVLVVPSLSEASGLSAIEAMALGTPVVATAVGGLPEVLAEGECGLLVAPSDPGAITSAVTRLLDEPDLVQRLVAAGRTRAEKVFSAERMVDEYLALYRELVP